MGDGSWASAGIYQHYREREHPEWPEPLALVEASMEELLERRRAPKVREPSGPLVVRPARDGERYRTWSYGRRTSRHDLDSARRTVSSRTYDATSQHVVLVAHEGRRLVGATVFYFVDTLDDEQTDINEIVGPGSVGPFFAKGDHDWGGHAIVMDSMWVASDRRAGIATMMAEQVAQIGLPAWGTFRDPWFAAFFLHRWPPARSMRVGTYWPLYEEYADAAQWADEDDAEAAELDVKLWLSDIERLEYEAAWGKTSAKRLLTGVLSTYDYARAALHDGGWDIKVQRASARAVDGGWRLRGRVSVSYIEEALLARASLEAFLAGPFETLQPCDDVAAALDATLFAAIGAKFPRDRCHIESWRLVGPEHWPHS